MSFSQFNFDANINKAIDTCGYTTATPVQVKAIPEILKRKDLIACAPTGTGKTAAFVLPALQRLTEIPKPGNKPRILILTPTRELAAQITGAAATYGKFLHFNIISLVGGMPYRQQLKNLSRAVDIIVATPGRLMDHMENRRLDLSSIDMLILDEADRMLDMGFIDDVKYISQATPNARQTLLFSATVDDRLKNIIKQLLKDPFKIDLSHEKISPAQIQQDLYYTDSMQHKTRLLQHFLENENIYKAIIFTATKVNADVLADELCDMEYSAAALHGDLKQTSRNKIVERLRQGKLQFVVATDVAARGIDISDLTHVFNYDLPKFSEDYVHRIGRTGRAGKSGIAISFASYNDGRHLQKIERYINQRLDVKIIEGLEPQKRSSAAPKSKSKPGGFKSKSPSRFSKNDRRDGGSKPRFDKGKEGSFSERRDFGGKSSFKPKSRFEKSEGTGSYERREAGAKAAFKPKSRFGKGEETRSYERRETGAKSSFSSKSRFERGDKKDSYERRDFSTNKPKSRFSKDKEAGSYERRDAGAGSFKPKSRFSKDESFRGQKDNNGKSDFKSKSRFVKKDSFDSYSRKDSGDARPKSRFAKDTSRAAPAKKEFRTDSNPKIKYVTRSDSAGPKKFKPGTDKRAKLRERV